MKELEVVSVGQVADAIPSGIYFGDDRTVTLCGANCPDRTIVADELRQAHVSTESAACLGGCATYGTLAAGTYARVPEFTDDGLVKNLVAIRPQATS